MRVLPVLVALWAMRVRAAQQAPPGSPSVPTPPPPDFFSRKSCFNGTLRGECLEIIINQICLDGNYTPSVAKMYYPESGEFSCQGIGCHLGTLKSQYCRPSRIPDLSKTPPNQRKTSPRSHLVTNNIVGPCGRYITEDTYRIVEKVAGQNCKMKLSRICYDCPPPGLPKQHHANGREHLLSPVQVILSYLRRGHEHLPRKKMLLEQMLLDSYQKLKKLGAPKDYVKAVRVNSTERNYPREQ